MSYMKGNFDPLLHQLGLSRSLSYLDPEPSATVILKLL